MAPGAKGDMQFDRCQGTRCFFLQIPLLQSHALPFQIPWTSLKTLPVKLVSSGLLLRFQTDGSLSRLLFMTNRLDAPVFDRGGREEDAYLCRGLRGLYMKRI